MNCGEIRRRSGLLCAGHLHRSALPSVRGHWPARTTGVPWVAAERGEYHARRRGEKEIARSGVYQTQTKGADQVKLKIADIEEIRRLRSGGMLLADIAKATGCSAGAVHKYSHDLVSTAERRRIKAIATKAVWGRRSDHNHERFTAEHRSWRGAIYRCTNSKNPAWDRYGGVGIKVCDRWLGSYEAFLEDMGRRPSPIHSLDRRDPNGDYEKTNCRWATKKEQSQNRAFVRLLDVDGQHVGVAEAARVLAMTECAFRYRMGKAGVHV